jgi:hypothetical protein
MPGRAGEINIDLPDDRRHAGLLQMKGQRRSDSGHFLTGQLTSRLDRILSICLRSRRANSDHIPDGTPHDDFGHKTHGSGDVI